MGLKICISSKPIGDVDTADQGITFEEPLDQGDLILLVTCQKSSSRERKYPRSQIISVIFHMSYLLIISRFIKK